MTCGTPHIEDCTPAYPVFHWPDRVILVLCNAQAETEDCFRIVEAVSLHGIYRAWVEPQLSMKFVQVNVNYPT